MNILIVDDEPLARARLRALLAELGYSDICGEAGNGKQAWEICKACQPDLVLLDIGMPGVNGMEAAERFHTLPRPPLVIFITAYSDYALEAFEHEAVDYLLKPIRKDRLHKALTRAQCLLQTTQPSEANSQARTHISIQAQGDLRMIPVNQIYYFRAEQKYVMLYWTKGEALVDDTLKHLEDEFAGQFLRIHRNALIAVVYVHSLERDAKNRYWISLQNCREKLEVSRRHLGAVKRILQDFRGTITGMEKTAVLPTDEAKASKTR